MSQPDRDRLMAYVDGQLSASERAEIEAWLTATPDAAAEVALLERQSDAMRALYGPIAAETVPDRLSVAGIARAQRTRRGQRLIAAAAALVLLVLGLGGGWLLRGQLDTPNAADRLIADAVSAHTVFVSENRHAVEVGSDDTEHLTNWLSNRLDTSLAMPDLTADGLQFLGGRLLPAPEVPGGRAAQLMYEDASGNRLTLYVTPAPATELPPYEVASLGLDTALFWADAAITCTITAPYSPDQLREVARNVFAQLNPRFEYAT
jgi:anti-sigma factor RsiW